jgi:toxin ParE1/3/4
VVRVDWSITAVADLEEIYRYIARDSRRYARATVEKITRASRLLADWPEGGERLAEFPAYRQIVVGNYRVIYREDPPNSRVIIIGVIHASRNMPPILEERQE